MALTKITDGLALRNILAAEIVTEEPTPKSYLIETASQASLKASLSSGEEKELRKKDTILAVNKTRDIVKGYDITFKDLLISPKVHALFEGGVTTEAEGGAFTSYTDPVVGSPVTRTKFTLNIYCGNIGTDGEADDAYTKFALTGCEGTPCDFDLQDDNFFSPSYTIKSRPAKGTTPLTMSAAATLPTVS